MVMDDPKTEPKAKTSSVKGPLGSNGQKDW